MVAPALGRRLTPQQARDGDKGCIQDGKQEHEGWDAHDCKHIGSPRLAGDGDNCQGALLLAERQVQI